MKDTIEYMVKSIVNKPDDVLVTQNLINGAMAYEISANIDDLKHIIGIRGKTIRAIRDIVYAIASKKHKRVLIKVLDPECKSQTPQNCG